MKNYLIYLIRTKWLQTTVMSLIPTMIIISFLVSSYNHRHYVSLNQRPIYLSIFPVFLIFLTTLIVVIRLAPLRNSKEVDLHYGLPISKKNLYFVHQFFGFLQVFIVWTFMFTFGMIVFTIISKGIFLGDFLIIIYPIGLFYSALIYILTSFIFMRAQTLMDGIVFILLTHLSLFLIPLSILLVYNQLHYHPMNPTLFHPLASIIIFTNAAIDFESPGHNDLSYLLSSNETYALALNTILYTSLSLVVLMYQNITANRDPVERIGHISFSWFGYKTQIPLIVFLLSLIVHHSRFRIGLDIIFLVLIGLSAIIGYFIYKRTVKIRIYDVALVIVSMTCGIVVSIIF